MSGNLHLPFTGKTARERMTDLQRSFPALAAAFDPAPEPFDAMELDKWTRGKSHGEKCAASFVLSVWHGGNGSTWPYRTRRFHLHEALGVWDESNHAAFLAWARDPWWP